MSEEKKEDDWLSNNKQQQSSYALPYNDLHFSYLTTEPAWGKESTKDLYEALELEVRGIKFDSDGTAIVSEIQKKNLWGMLSYFTRDLRLGNLSYATGEMQYCRFWIELAGDALRYGFIKSFVAAMAKAITTVELSQSKGGFFRKRANTITKEDISDTNPRSFFGKGGKKNE